MKKIILMTMLAVLFAVAGCAQIERDEEELLIMTSSFPMYEFAREIAPNEDVQMLIQPGADVHHYDLKPSDMIKLDKSDLIIFIGEDMEPWLEAVLDLDGKHKNKTLRATKKVELIKAEHSHSHGHSHDDNSHDDRDDHGHEHEDDDHGHEHEDDDHGHEHEDDEHDHGHDDHVHDSEYDPHIWLDFENNIKIVNAIAEKLTTLKPENAEEYKQNAEEYITKLKELNEKYAQELETCEIRAFITNHDSFRYLAQKYDLKQIPIRGLSAEQEPSPRTIENIIKEAREHNIQHVFFEELASPRVSEALAKELNAETLMLTPAENIPARDWGEKTFIDLMNENLENLKTGLRCE